MSIDYTTIKKAHFIGIGGIGISAIARMMLLEGKEVSGSDSTESQVTKELQKLGAKVFYGQKKEQVPEDADLVIYTIAIPEDNEELLSAKEKNISTLTYPQMLGVISKEKYTIAVSGTHGKTTTTGMLAKILIEAGLNPTVIIGSFLKDINSNFIVGKPTEGLPAMSAHAGQAGQKDIFLIEACEYRRSFLNLSPDILVITNIDEDHLDYYKDLEDIQSAFKELVGRVKEGGVIVTDANDEVVSPVLEGTDKKVIDYTTCDKGALSLPFPGEHNLKNACSALSVSGVLGVPKETAGEALSHFGGTWRRFEFKGENKKGAKIYDDYGHHPTEIEKTITAFKEAFPDKKVSVLFQPHLYSRTKLLFDDFVEALSLADGIAIADIYAAREKKDPDINSEMLVNAINEKGEDKAIYTPTFENMVQTVCEWPDSDDVVVTMGAGDIYKVGEELLK